MSFSDQRLAALTLVVPASTSGDDIFTVTAGELTSASGFDGGEGIDKLQLSGGGIFNLTLPSPFQSIEIINGSDTKDVIEIDAAHLSGVATIDGGGGVTNSLWLFGNDFDLRSKTIINFASVAFTDDAGTTVTINDADNALRLFGRVSTNDKVILTGGTFTAAQRQTLFDNGIDIIQDDSSTTPYTNTAPQITSLNGDRISAVPITDVVFLDAGGDATITDTDGDLASIKVEIAAGGAAGDGVGISQAGRVKLNQTSTSIDVTVDGTLIGQATFMNGGRALFVQLSSGASLNLVQELIRSLTLVTNGPASTPDGERKVTVTIGDTGMRQVTSTITVGESNIGPTQIELSHASVRELAAKDVVIGTLSATDSNMNESFTYELLDNAGGRFAIRGNQLVIADGTKLDFETAQSHIIKVKVTDKGNASAEKVFTISVTDALEAVRGTRGKDVLVGGIGSDKIVGGPGSDVLIGKAGQDAFVFDVKPSAKTNRDTITDFTVGEDKIWLDNAVFRKLGRAGSEDVPAKLSKQSFVVGTKAKDGNDYLIYNKKTGKLLYDQDGSGSKKPVEVALLGKNLELSAGDFLIV